MKYLIIVIFLGLVTGCGQGGPKVDSGAKAYYDQFMAEAGSHRVAIPDWRNNNLNVVIQGITDPDVAGTCDISAGSYEVTLDSDYWALADDDEKTMLVFHELGHCLLDRDHRTDLNSDGMPVSIMNPYLFDSVYFHDHYASYVNELFTHMNDWLNGV